MDYQKKYEEINEPVQENISYTLNVTSLDQQLTFSIPKDQEPPQKIRLFNRAESITLAVFDFENKSKKYIELTRDELERFDRGYKTGRCRHSEAVNRETGDERFDKRLAKLQKKLREKKNNEYQCSYCEEYGGVYNIEMETTEAQDNTGDNTKTKRDDLKLSEPKVVVLGSSSIKISWLESVANNEHLAECTFELQMSKSKNSSFDNVYSGLEKTFTQIDLFPGTKYYFRLRAVKESIKGPFSTEVCVVTDAAAPSTPDVPHLSNKTKTSLLLKWTTKSDNGSPITGYIMQWDHAGNSGDSFQTIYEGSQKQYKFNHKLPPMTSCRFRVKAVNKIGQSEFSPELHCTTSAGVPSAPESPVATKATANSIQLSWKKPNCNGAEITEYSLEMDSENKGHGFLVVYRGIDQQCTVKDNLKRNTAYRFRLCAINAQGNSKWSDVISHSTMSMAPGRMLSPILDGKIHTKSFAVSWIPSSDDGGSEILSYSLEIDDGKEGPFHKAYTGLDMDYKFQDLLPGHMYKVRVSCATSRFQSPWSDAAVFTTFPVIPAPPSGLRESKKQKPQPYTIELQWDPPSYNGGAKISNYNVHMRKSDNEDFRHIYFGPKTSCCAGGLLPVCKYSFCVRAQNCAGDSKFSPILHITSGPGAPDAVRELQLVCRSSNVIKISWKVPKINGAPVTGYNLEWGENTKGPFEKLYSGASNNYDVKKGILPSTEYYFRVQASSVVGNSPWSDVVSCKTPVAPPAQVSQLKVLGQTSTSLTLQWREPHNSGTAITSYNIDIIGHEMKSYVVDDSETTQDVGGHNSCLLQHTLSALIPHTQYRFRVQGVNKSGCGAFSSVISAKTGNVPPEAPSLEMTNSSYQSIKLHWKFIGAQSKANELKYDLQKRSGDEGSFETVYEGPGSSYKVGKLQEQTSYSFRIRAANEAGYGPYSDIFICQTTVQPPPSVKGFNYSKLSRSKVTLSWNNVSPVHSSDRIHYMLQWQRKDVTQLEKVYEGNQTDFTYNNLISDQTYSFRVCAVRILVDGRKIQSGFTPLLSLAVPSEEEESVSSPTLSLDQNDEKLEDKQLTEKQLALIFFFSFAAIVLLISLLISYVVG